MTRPKNLHDLREEMLGVARGERKPSPRPAAPVLAALTTEALDLLGVILRDEPATISRLVEITGRAQSNVSRSVQHLAKLGLVRLVREGREVRPEAVARSLTIDLVSGTYSLEKRTEIEHVAPQRRVNERG